MFGKLLFIVLCCGLAAAGLLVLRQQRIQAAHEMSALHKHLLANERSLWSLRADIAHRCRPEEIRRLMEPMPFEWITMAETAAPASETAVPLDVPPDAPGAPAPAAPTAHTNPTPVISTATADDEEPFGG